MIVGVLGFGQSPLQLANTNLNHGGLYDRFGTEYSIKDVQIETSSNSSLGSKSSITLLCSSGIFDLYFETGCGMEGTSAVEIQRRAVVCQAFSDLSDFINSPLKNVGNINRVNIWIRPINNIINATIAAKSGALAVSSGFYSIPYNNSKGGILDTMLWQTINSGNDSYTNNNIILPSTGLNNRFHHGFISVNYTNTSFNWNNDLSINSPVGLIDFYSIIFHEAMHLLGFNSLINETGNSSVYFNQPGIADHYYSRYDKFLSSNGTNLITNASDSCNMYDYIFNPNLNTNVLYPDCTNLNHLNLNSSVDKTICGKAITYTGNNNTPIPLYTPQCFESGSSLSHFEDQLYPTCNYANNNLYFAMSNAIGSISKKRFLRPEERNVLSDIGYSVKTTYGNVAQHSFIDYTIPLNSSIVGGINDGLNADQSFQFIGTMGQTINITNILANDYTNNSNIDYSPNLNNLRFSCLEDLSTTTSFSASNLSVSSGDLTTSISFVSNVPGLHILRYVPINIVTNQKGNLTYVFVYVFDNSSCATPINDNLVNNGNFEQYSNLPCGGICVDYPQIIKACGWRSSCENSTPDYFNALSVFNTNYNFQIPCNHAGFENDNRGYAAYAGIAGAPKQVNNFIPVVSGGQNESIITQLKQPLLANTKYQLCFDVSLAEGSNSTAIKLQAYLSKKLIIESNRFVDLPLNNSSMLFTNPTFSTISNGWERISFTFTTDSLGGEKYLYLGGLKNVQYKNIPLQPDENICDHYNFNYGLYTDQGYYYYYLDNVDLRLSPDVIFNLPKSVCINSNLNNLSDFITTSQPISGTFSGDGVINNNGVYSFNATTAGLGIHQITFFPLNTSLCVIPISCTITVVSSGIIPTFNSIAPICLGSTFALPTTSTNAIGITGAWSPTANNTATTTYTFTPATGQCATTATLTVTVLPASDPSCGNTNNNCGLSTLTLSVPEPNTTVLYRRQNSIITNTNYLVATGKKVTMRAGDFISLKPNTYINSGAVFSAKIEPCVLSKTAKVGLEQKIESELINNIVLFPNPNNGTFELMNIDTTLFGNHSIQLNVYDLNGRNLFSKNLSDSEIPNCQVDLQQFSDGMYIVKLISESYSQDFKFIKK